MTGIFPALFALFFFAVLSPASAAVSSQGTLISVSGKVEVRPQAGGPGRSAKVGTLVGEGQRVVTGKDSGAILEFFDGSQVILKPGTDFWLSKLRKPSAKDKILHFKLLAGALLAQVTKLASASSSFEIEAGGVVCGVRGTQFSMEYDPAKDQVLLEVKEGRVYARSRGWSQDFGAGERGRFHQGRWAGRPGGEGLPPSVPPPHLALDDMRSQFQRTVRLGHDAVQTDPAVGGALNLHLVVGVPGQENLP
ncbi:MAG TPA: FecR family protein [bacterium]|nr:FecR family protein [bacterium]